MYTETHATFKVKIGYEERWIECVSHNHVEPLTEDELKYGMDRYLHLNYDRFTSVAPVALARVGRTGTKLWPSRVTIWREKTADANGVFRYRANMSSVHLNRQSVIVDWNKPELDRYRSQHNSAWMGKAEVA